jgi:hypothetical protein
MELWRVGQIIVVWWWHYLTKKRVRPMVRMLMKVRWTMVPEVVLRSGFF